MRAQTPIDQTFSLKNPGDLIFVHDPDSGVSQVCEVVQHTLDRLRVIAEHQGKKIPVTLHRVYNTKNYEMRIRDFILRAIF